MTWFGASCFLLSFLILIPENKLFQLYFNLLFRLDPNFQSPKCFLKIWSLSHVRYPVKVLVFYSIYWDSVIKHKEESEVICIWTVRRYGGISNWYRSRWQFRLSASRWKRDLQVLFRCRCSWWLWQQLSPLAGGSLSSGHSSHMPGGRCTLPSAVRGLLRCASYLLSEYPWVTQTPVGCLCSVRVILERHKVNGYDKFAVLQKLTSLSSKFFRIPPSFFRVCCLL